MGAGWQRCPVHFQRNLLARVGKINKPVVSAKEKTVFAETDRDQAHARWREVADGRRLKLHSTNPLERVNREIKRRTNIVGIFPNREAVIRLMLEQNDECAVSCRDMPVEKLTALCNDTDAATMIAAQ